MSANHGKLDFDVDVNLPVSGTTAAARHASATGAQAAAVVFGTRASQVLAVFARYGRLTIAQAAELTGVKESSVCSAWARLERAGFIEGTAEFFTYTCHRRLVKREYHQLTAIGRSAALEHLRARNAFEARS